MDGTRDCHTEWSKLDKEGEISHSIYAESKKKYETNELIFRTETNLQT